MDPVAPRHPESDDPSDTDLPPAASPGPAVPEATAAPPAPRHRTPLLGISLALVAILAGSGLFLSGYSLGRQAAAEPGTAPSDEAAFQPFWDTYHTISDRYAGGEIDRGELVQGAIKGMIDSLDDPFSQYLSADQYLQSLQTISGQFEGIGANLGFAGGGRHPGLRSARDGMPPAGHQVARWLARGPGRPDRRRHRPVRRRDLRSTGSPSTPPGP